MPEFIDRKNVQQLRDLLETTCNESLREILVKKLAAEESAAHSGEHRRPSGTKTPDRAA
jgi:hypothetical protein